MTAHRDHLLYEQQLSQAQAWHTANYTKARRLPSLSSVLNSRSRPITRAEREWAEEIRAAEGYREIPPHLTSSGRSSQEGATA